MYCFQNILYKTIQLNQIIQFYGNDISDKQESYSLPRMQMWIYELFSKLPSKIGKPICVNLNQKSHKLFIQVCLCHFQVLLSTFSDFRRFFRNKFTKDINCLCFICQDLCKIVINQYWNEEGNIYISRIDLGCVIFEFHSRGHYTKLIGCAPIRFSLNNTYTINCRTIGSTFGCLCWHISKCSLNSLCK